MIKTKKRKEKEIGRYGKTIVFKLNVCIVSITLISENNKINYY